MTTQPSYSSSLITTAVPPSATPPAPPTISELEAKIQLAADRAQLRREMSEETKAFREFLEKQLSTVKATVFIAGSIVLAVLTIFGFKTLSDIDDKVRKEVGIGIEKALQETKLREQIDHEYAAYVRPITITALEAETASRRNFRETITDQQLNVINAYLADPDDPMFLRVATLLANDTFLSRVSEITTKNWGEQLYQLLQEHLTPEKKLKLTERAEDRCIAALVHFRSDKAQDLLYSYLSNPRTPLYKGNEELAYLVRTRKFIDQTKLLKTIQIRIERCEKDSEKETYLPTLIPLLAQINLKAFLDWAKDPNSLTEMQQRAVLASIGSTGSIGFLSESEIPRMASLIQALSSNEKIRLSPRTITTDQGSQYAVELGLSRDISSPYSKAIAISDLDRSWFVEGLGQSLQDPKSQRFALSQWLVALIPPVDKMGLTASNSVRHLSVAAKAEPAHKNEYRQYYMICNVFYEDASTPENRSVPLTFAPRQEELSRVFLLVRKIDTSEYLKLHLGELDFTTLRWD